MKPVAIFRHAPSEGPGYFATFLAENGIPMELIAVDQGAAVPRDPVPFGGLVFMGGPMSVNDDLPWIAPTLALIRDAVARDIPVLGHCLGGQLIAKALGATVGANPVKEIGWGDVSSLDNAVARDWFGAPPAGFLAFHWHGETFNVPEGAVRILESRYCPNQAFALGTKHLAMQCHVEMTEEMVKTWCAIGADEVAAAAASPAVQAPNVMQERLAERIATLNGAAARIYRRWIRGLVA